MFRACATLCVILVCQRQGVGQLPVSEINDGTTLALATNQAGATGQIAYASWNLPHPASNGSAFNVIQDCEDWTNRSGLSSCRCCPEPTLSIAGHKVQAWASAGGAIGFNTPYESFLPVGFSNRDIWQLNEVGAIVKHGIEADRPWRHCTKCRSRWGYRIDGFYGPNARFLNTVGFESTWVNDVYQWALPNAYASYAIDSNTKVRVGNTLSPFADEQELYSLHNPVQTKSLLSLFNPITHAGGFVEHRYDQNWVFTGGLHNGANTFFGASRASVGGLLKAEYTDERALWTGVLSLGDRGITLGDSTLAKLERRQRHYVTSLPWQEVCNQQPRYQVDTILGGTGGDGFYGGRFRVEVSKLRRVNRDCASHQARKRPARPTRPVAKRSSVIAALNDLRLPDEAVAEAPLAVRRMLRNLPGPSMRLLVEDPSLLSPRGEEDDPASPLPTLAGDATATDLQRIKPSPGPLFFDPMGRIAIDWEAVRDEASLGAQERNAEATAQRQPPRAGIRTGGEPPKKRELLGSLDGWKVWISDGAVIVKDDLGDTVLRAQENRDVRGRRQETANTKYTWETHDGERRVVGRRDFDGNRVAWEEEFEYDEHGAVESAKLTEYELDEEGENEVVREATLYSDGTEVVIEKFGNTTTRTVFEDGKITERTITGYNTIDGKIVSSEVVIVRSDGTKDKRLTEYGTGDLRVKTAITETHYDSEGRITSQTRTAYDPYGQLRSDKLDITKRVRFTYDPESDTYEITFDEDFDNAWDEPERGTTITKKGDQITITKWEHHLQLDHTEELSRVTIDGSTGTVSLSEEDEYGESRTTKVRFTESGVVIEQETYSPQAYDQDPPDVMVVPPPSGGDRNSPDPEPEPQASEIAPPIFRDGGQYGRDRRPRGYERLFPSPQNPC